MKRYRKKFAIVLLSLIAGLSAMPLFLPELPLNATDTEIRLVAFEEADDNAFEGLLRSSHEGQEEISRSSNDSSSYPELENFLSVSLLVQLAEVIQQEGSRRPVEYYYLQHSSLLI